MMTNDAVYIDTMDPGQANARVIDLEENDPRAFFSETTVASLIWDLFDGISMTPPEANAFGPPISDNVELGVEPIFNAMVNGVKRTPAFVTVFALLANLVAAAPDPGFKQVLVNLARAHNIDVDLATINEFEQTGPPRTINMVLPGKATPTAITFGRLYTTVDADAGDVTVFDPGLPFEGAPLKVDTAYDPLRNGNKLGDYAFFKVEIPVASGYTVTVVPTTPDVALRMWVKLPTGTVAQPSKLADLATNTSIAGRWVFTAPGSYAVAVQAVQKDKNGNWVPAFAQFRIRVDRY
jgi:surface-anchored protein